jgi:hypothetical protein
MADRHAGGDCDRLHQMWISGELMSLYEREAIAGLRRHGKHDLADHYERLMTSASSFKPRESIGELMRALGLS